jgi:hypothetical protein
MTSAFLTLWVDSFSLIKSILVTTGVWVTYLVFSDFLFFFIYEVSKAKFNSDLTLVFKNFSFRNREKSLQVFTSDYSPVFMRISLFKGVSLVFNERLIKDFSLEEVRAYLDLELSYTNTLGSFVEVLIQRVYLVTWVPTMTVLTILFGKTVSTYLLGPLTLLYKYVITMCRKDFNYEGKFAATLPQILFKVKILDMSQGKVPLFNFSEQCAHLMLNNKSGDQSVTRFDPDELFR